MEDTRPTCEIIVIAKSLTAMDAAFSLVRGWVETHDRPAGVYPRMN